MRVLTAGARKLSRGQVAGLAFVFLWFFIGGIMHFAATDTEARIVPARYATMAQCRAALPDQLARNTDVPFPMIGADCRRSGAQIVKTDAATPKG